MRLLARPIVNDFIRKHPPACTPLNDWFRKTEKADWRDFIHVKETFNTCDYIGNDRYVFNIGGNNYRVVAMINFKTRFVYIRGVLTHAAYDSIKGKLDTL